MYLGEGAVTNMAAAAVQLASASGHQRSVRCRFSNWVRDKTEAPAEFGHRRAAGGAGNERVGGTPI